MPVYLSISLTLYGNIYLYFYYLEKKVRPLCTRQKKKKHCTNTSTTFNCPLNSFKLIHTTSLLVGLESLHSIIKRLWINFSWNFCSFSSLPPSRPLLPLYQKNLNYNFYQMTFQLHTVSTPAMMEWLGFLFRRERVLYTLFISVCTLYGPVVNIYRIYPPPPLDPLLLAILVIIWPEITFHLFKIESFNAKVKERLFLTH